jgi:hypothetical protein
MPFLHSTTYLCYLLLRAESYLLMFQQHLYVSHAPQTPPSLLRATLQQQYPPVQLLNPGVHLGQQRGTTFLQSASAKSPCASSSCPDPFKIQALSLQMTRPNSSLLRTGPSQSLTQQRLEEMRTMAATMYTKLGWGGLLGASLLGCQASWLLFPVGPHYQVLLISLQQPQQQTAGKESLQQVSAEKTALRAPAQEEGLDFERNIRVDLLSLDTVERAEANQRQASPVRGRAWQASGSEFRAGSSRNQLGKAPLPQAAH